MREGPHRRTGTGTAAAGDGDVSLLLFNLPPFFDAVAMELLLQPPTSDATLESTAAEYAQVVRGVAWGAYSGIRFAIAAVDAAAAAPFVMDDGAVADVLQREERREALGVVVGRKGVEGVGAARSRGHWRAAFLHPTQFERFEEEATRTAAPAMAIADDENDDDDDDGERTLEEVHAALLARQSQRRAESSGGSGGGNDASPSTHAAATGAAGGALPSLAARSLLATGSEIVITRSPVPFEAVDSFAGGAASRGWARHVDEQHVEEQRKRPHAYLPRPPEVVAATDRASKAQRREGDTPAATTASDACKKCGSSDHLTRRCPGRATTSEADGAAPLAAESNQKQPPPPTAATPATAVGTTPSDACKHCGSSDHLSRRCPKKA